MNDVTLGKIEGYIKSLSASEIEQLETEARLKLHENPKIIIAEADLLTAMDEIAYERLREMGQ